MNLPMRDRQESKALRCPVFSCLVYAVGVDRPFPLGVYVEVYG